MSKSVENYELFKDGVEMLTAAIKELEIVIKASFYHIKHYQKAVRSYTITPSELEDMIRLINEMDKTTKNYDHILLRLFEFGLITNDFYTHALMYEYFSQFQKALYEDLLKMEQVLVKKQKKLKIKNFIHFIFQQIMH
jgi:hypothetical protein